MPITKLCKIAAQDPPTSLLRCPKTTDFPRHPAVVQKKENRYYFFCMYFSAGISVTSFPFRVSYLNTPFQLLHFHTRNQYHT